MSRRHGLQLDIVLSMLVVVVTATGILAGLLFRTYESRSRQMRSLTAVALRDAGVAPLARISVPGQIWWKLTPDGNALAPDGQPSAIDRESLALGRDAQTRKLSLLREGMPWEPIRFALPLERNGYAMVTWIPPAASRAVLMALLAGEVVVFTVFGGVLLRRRVVVPMQRMALAAGAIADGDLAARLPIEGLQESAEVAVAFNEMAAALESRTCELEKAVRGLRESNRDLREAREGLHRSERLAAVGRLAAGVAHEVGNPMGALLAFLDLAKRDEGISEASRGYLERAGKEGERIRAILRQVLEFSSPSRSAKLPVEMESLCEETASLLRAQRRYEGISIDVFAEGDPPEALTDSNGVSQILLNLLLNAADALKREAVRPASGERGGGAAGASSGSARDRDPRIRITVRPAQRAERAEDPRGRADEHRALPGAVECIVRDNGPGIDIADRERIFDPFFTTNAPGEGTGLGLSNAARIAEELGGELIFDGDTDGRGACFVLRLPAVGDESPVDARVRASR